MSPEEGTTRDRTYRPAEFLGERFQVVDTGGLVFDDDENTLFAKEIRDQAMVAIEESSGVVLVVDGQAGITSMDLQIAEFLRREVVKDIPVVVAVNKCESEKVGGAAAADFWQLGLGTPHAVSALHGVGTAEILESLFESIRDRGTAFPGFGTKAENLEVAKKNMKHKGPLPWEDDTDYKMRKYGIGDPAQRVLDDYDAAVAAFEDEDRPEEINVAIMCVKCVGWSSFRLLSVVLHLTSDFVTYSVRLPVLLRCCLGLICARVSGDACVLLPLC